MIKLFIISLYLLFGCGQYVLFAQENKPITQHSPVSAESNINNEDNYKLYPTKNIWTFLKLDTRTGKIWQVQYTIEGDEYRFQTILNEYDLSYDDNTQVDRFELYPTENIYNFLLLDKKDGRVWQVQWSQEKDKRMILNIDGASEKVYSLNLSLPKYAIKTDNITESEIAIKLNKVIDFLNSNENVYIEQLLIAKNELDNLLKQYQHSFTFFDPELESHIKLAATRINEMIQKKSHP